MKFEEVIGRGLASNGTRLVRITLFEGQLVSITERTGELLAIPPEERLSIEMAYGHQLGTYGVPEDKLIHWSDPDPGAKPGWQPPVPTAEQLAAGESCVTLFGPWRIWLALRWELKDVQSWSGRVAMTMLGEDATFKIYGWARTGPSWPPRSPHRSACAWWTTCRRTRAKMPKNVTPRGGVSAGPGVVAAGHVMWPARRHGCNRTRSFSRRSVPSAASRTRLDDRPCVESVSR